jgi:hypothetical protein
MQGRKPGRGKRRNLPYMLTLEELIELRAHFLIASAKMDVEFRRLEREAEAGGEATIERS